MIRVAVSLVAVLLAAAPALPAGAAGRPSAPQLTMPQGASPAAGRLLLREGVLVVPESATAIAALDAATGEPLWRFEDADAAAVGGDTLLALSDHLVVLATPDARLLALELRSGRLLWEVEAADTGKGYRYETAPLVADGRVVAPIGGCDAGTAGACWVAAYDAATGAVLWRRPLEGGGAVSWVSPIYDEETGSLFVGTTAGGGTAGRFATYALDAETGAIRWVRQETRAPRPVLDSAAVEGPGATGRL